MLFIYFDLEKLYIRSPFKIERILETNKEKLESRDHRGNLVDFVFCRNCVTFITITGKKEGDEIICFKCRTDKSIIV